MSDFWWAVFGVVWFPSGVLAAGLYYGHFFGEDAILTPNALERRLALWMVLMGLPALLGSLLGLWLCRKSMPSVPWRQMFVLPYTRRDRAIEAVRRIRGTWRETT